MTAVGIVLQARMGSRRCPGKVLKDIYGVPMIERILARLKRARRASVCVLAVPEGSADDPLARTGESLGVEVLRGSEADVLSRYREAARRYGLDCIVRATGDNPLVDVEELDALVDFHLRRAYDYSSSRTSEGSGLPIGAGVEVFSREAIERSAREARDPRHREHVDEYIQSRALSFRTGVHVGPRRKRASSLCLTVDWPEQLRWMEALHRELSDLPEIRTEDVLACVRSGRIALPPRPREEVEQSSLGKKAG